MAAQSVERESESDLSWLVECVMVSGWAYFLAGSWKNHRVGLGFVKEAELQQVHLGQQCFWL